LALVLLGAVLGTGVGRAAAWAWNGGPAGGAQAAQSGYAPTFEVTGAVARPRSYTLDDLRRLPAIDVIHQGVLGGTHAWQGHAYRGVLLWS
jgi:hypothetical protein